MDHTADASQSLQDASGSLARLNASGADSTFDAPTSQPVDPYNLIDLSDSGNCEINWKPLQPKKIVDGPHSFVQELQGLQLSNADIHHPMPVSNHVPSVQSSLVPSRSKRTSKRVGIRREVVTQQRSSTPESIASEIRWAQETVDPVDPYTQWYQVMQNYYKQFYPTYNYDQKQPRQQQHYNSLPRSAVPVMQQQPCQQVPTRGSNAAALPPGMTGWPMPYPAMSGKPGTSQQQQQSMMDYAQFYYQYYMNTMVATQGWPGMPTGRTTPKIFIEPHIRVTLSSPGIMIQVLPNRPREGESGRVELIDIGQLASDVVAEATSLLTDRGRLHASRAHVGSSTIFPSGQTSSEEGQASSLSDDDADEVEDGYAALVAVWDRADHALYPGPLCHGTTLKHDVLAFLGGKLEDIQDRMPIDWDSADLLLAYLKLLIKNNGVAHPSDVVNLLLENDSSMTRNYDGYSTTAGLTRLSTLPLLQRHANTSSAYDNGHNHYAAAANSPLTSGRESPRILTHSASTGAFFQQRSGTPSSTGGAASISKLLRKSGGLVGTSQERELMALNRFRELLMHGHPLKALDQACQQQLWGHAFALAHRLGGAALERVMNKFLGKAVHPSDPLLTLYHLTAGEMPPAVDQMAYVAGGGEGSAAAGDWRPHLAIILSTSEMNHHQVAGSSSSFNCAGLARDALQRLGESLLARRLLYAAHLCFLLASSTPLHPRIWLLGIQTPTDDVEYNRFAISPSVERAPAEAIQLTEVYEYALGLAARDRYFFLPQFLPFKFVYCLRLLDAGLVEKAFRYLEVLGLSLVVMLQQEGEEKPPLTAEELQSLFTMASHCLRLAERLQFHPEVRTFGFETNSPEWIGRLQGAYWKMCSVLGLPNDRRPYVDPPVLYDHQQQQQQHVEQPDGQTPTPGMPPQTPQQQQPPIASSSTAQGPQSYTQPQQQQQQHAMQDSITQQQLQHQQQQAPHVGQFQPQGASPTPQPSAMKHNPLQRHQQLYPLEEAATAPPHPPPIHHQHYQHHHEQPQHQQSADLVNNSFHQQPVPYHMCETVAAARSQQHQPSTTPKEIRDPAPSLHVDLQHQQQHRPPAYLPSGSPLTQQQLSPSPPTPQQQQQHHGFFVPTTMMSSTTFDEDQSHLSTPLQAQPPTPYDYFAGLSMQQQQYQAASRSRTVSSSSHQSSSAAVSAVTLQGRSTQPSHQQRDNGPPASRRGVRSRNFSSNSTTLAGISGSSTSASPPPGKTTAKANENHAERSQDAKQESEDPAKPPTEGQKSGWFSGFFGRMKKGQDVYLPDDSAPSIVWDEKAGCWRDSGNPNPTDTTPLPPPMIPPGIAKSTPTSNAAPANPVSPAPPSAIGGGARNSARSRYVNVMANSTMPRAKTPLNPLIPKPPSMTPG